MMKGFTCLMCSKNLMSRSLSVGSLNTVMSVLYASFGAYSKLSMSFEMILSDGAYFPIGYQEPITVDHIGDQHDAIHLRVRELERAFRGFDIVCQYDELGPVLHVLEEHQF